MNNLKLTVNEAVVLSPSLSEIITYSPLKKVYLWIKKPSDSKILIDGVTLNNLFLALSKKKLEFLTLGLYPTVNEETTVDEMEELSHSFT